jgi:hypothetical protein
VERGTNGDTTARGEATTRASTCKRYIAKAIPAAHKESRDVSQKKESKALDSCTDERSVTQNIYLDSRRTPRTHVFTTPARKEGVLFEYSLLRKSHVHQARLQEGRDIALASCNCVYVDFWKTKTKRKQPRVRSLTDLRGFFIQRRRRSVRHEELLEMMLEHSNAKQSASLFSHATAHVQEVRSFQTTARTNYFTTQKLVLSSEREERNRQNKFGGSSLPSLRQPRPHSREFWHSLRLLWQCERSLDHTLKVRIPQTKLPETLQRRSHVCRLGLWSWSTSALQRKRTV